MDQLFQDLRYALRQIGRTPQYALAVVVTLALTIGANAAFFSLVNALVFRTLPVPDPGQLAVLQATDERGQNRSIYYSTFTELAALQVFDTLSLFSGGGVFSIEVRGALNEGTIEASTPGLFEALGLQPHLGRFFTDDDSPADHPSAAVVVVSYDFWRKTFDEDPKAIGETVLIDGTPATVIGVTPPHYKGFYADGGYGFSVPLTFLNRQLASGPARPVRGLNAVGRLATGVSLEEARAATEAAWPAIRVSAVPAALSPTERQDVATQRIHLESAATGFSSLRRQYQQPLEVLWAFTTVLLMIGCINLSGLLLARTTSRQHQWAICFALGASRLRIVRQLLIESLVLSLAGAAVAVLLAWWSTRSAGVLLWQGSVPLARPLTPDGMVLGFTTAVAVCTALVMSLLPAWSASRNRPQGALRPDHRVTPAVGWPSKALMAGQVGLSLVLLFGAGLLSSSLWKLRALDTGVRVEDVRWSRLFSVPGGYRNQKDAVYYPELVRRLSDVPGVQSVALASYFPAALGAQNLLTPQRMARAEASHLPAPAFGIVENITPRFFETVGIRLLGGRDFNWDDTAEHPEVVVVNETLSRMLFPEGNTVGRSIQIGDDPRRGSVEIVGVVSDAAIGSYRQPHAPMAFRPRMQELERARAPVMVFRTAQGTSVVDDAIGHVIAGLGHEYPRRFFSLAEHIDRALLRERLLAALSSFFAGLAALLSFVGLYSLLAYAVAQRTREIGIRMALGATRGDMIRMVTREGLAVTLIGVAIGVPCALAAGRLIASFLFGLEPTDLWTLFFASALFVIIGGAAGLRPASRASRVDPLTALRAD